MRRGPTAYARERRYVLACAAAILDNTFAEGARWLHQRDDASGDDAPEHVVRRRELALTRLVAELRRRGKEPTHG